MVVKEGVHLDFRGWCRLLDAAPETAEAIELAVLVCLPEITSFSSGLLEFACFDEEHILVRVSVDVAGSYHSQLDLLEHNQTHVVSSHSCSEPSHIPSGHI